MQAIRRFILLSLTMAMLLSCNSVDLSHVESSYKGISPLELKLGNRASGLMQARYRLVYDKNLQKYITEIRLALLANTTLNFENGEMVLVKDPGVFAYAIPNGDIYLSSGMLLLAEDEPSQQVFLDTLIATFMPDVLRNMLYYRIVQLMCLNKVH